MTIKLTQKAAEKLKEIAKEEDKVGYGLKIQVLPGGCSGFMYGMDFQKDPDKEDLVFEEKGIKFYVEKDSVDLIKDSEIDFTEYGFKIDNPNKIGCGCNCGNGGCD